MAVCVDAYLLHVISLVDWPKHVKFFFLQFANFMYNASMYKYSLSIVFCTDRLVNMAYTRDHDHSQLVHDTTASICLSAHICTP